MGGFGSTPARLLLLCIVLASITNLEASYSIETRDGEGRRNSSERRVIGVNGGPAEVVWAVQLSDLHFSVFHPDRALDLQRLVAPALSFIHPSLVLITGDLTDGKSKDHTIMKQNEEEWKEYQNIMENVVRKSGLDKNIFYDLRGNHDSFGVPEVGGSFDYFSKYSISGQLGRSGKVHSVTLEAGNRKHLFVGLDTTPSVGLRGPTNLFGHPTDQLLTKIDTELSQWDSQSEKPATKITFGHFPLSFSAASPSGKSLEDLFLKHSLSAYLCGHLHESFGKNLKRHHQSGSHSFSLQKNLQLNIHQLPSQSKTNCSAPATPAKEFWEWEMGDWRKNRAMRVLAIDRGQVSFIDVDFRSGAKRTIILPTFPLDSRFLSIASPYMYKCLFDPSPFEMIRTLVFSSSPIASVIARVYDSSPGHLSMVLETAMSKQEDNFSRGDLYTAIWNFKAFEDPSPLRYWLQIETTDIMGRSSMTEVRPFSINGFSARLSWTWKEFYVMGCQWDALYFPVMWLLLSFSFAILLISKALLLFSRQHYSYKNFSVNKGFINGIAWALREFDSIPPLCSSMLGYLFYLVLFPWFWGQVFIDGGERGYMTYKGWVLKPSSERKKLEFLGSPDIMVVVLPHLLFVVLPAIFLAVAMAAERGVYRVHFLTLTGKKNDNQREHKESLSHGYQGNGRSRLNIGKRWIRNFMLLLCLAIYWKHFKSCRALMKAYVMNPFLHFPVYSFVIPVFLAYAAYKTREV